MSQILMLISLGVVVLWTARLAMSKGFKPWIWAGASIFLLLAPKLAGYDWNFLGMLPLVVLLFLRRAQPVEYPETPLEVTCPQCHSLQAWGHRYCDRCGSEMEHAEAVEPPRNGNLAPTPTYDWENDSRPADPDRVQPVPEATVGGTVEAPPEAAPEAVSNFTPPANATPESPPVAEAAVAAGDPPVDQGSDPEAPTEPGVDTPPEQPAEPVPPPVKVFSGPPTPARMTERGLDMLREGLFQQAVDQFTKAIALDPNFKIAWEHRAEAYERMGRDQQAAEDRWRLEAFG